MAVVAGVVVLGSLLFVRGRGEAPGSIATPEQKAEAGEQYGWLVKAMAECEEEAKRTTDKLYFLIAPVTRTATNAAGWEPGRIGTVGDSIELLPSTNAVIGLRNGSLAIYRTPLTFAVSDPATSTVFRWKPAAGVTVLTQRAAGLRVAQARIPGGRGQGHRMGHHHQSDPGHVLLDLSADPDRRARRMTGPA